MRQPKTLQDMQDIIDAADARFRRGEYTVARTPQEIRDHMRALLRSAEGEARGDGQQPWNVPR